MTEPPLAGLFSQQVREPIQENNYRATLKKLTPIDDETSRLVSSQYEENPYPRWVRITFDRWRFAFSAFLASELGLESPRFARQDDKIDVPYSWLRYRAAIDPNGAKISGGEDSGGRSQCSEPRLREAKDARAGHCEHRIRTG